MACTLQTQAGDSYPSNSLPVSSTVSITLPASPNLRALKLNACIADDAEKMRRLADDLELFWRDALPVMDGAVESSSLHNIARLSCIVDKLVKQQSPPPSDGVIETKVHQ